ncbi:MAG: hypothetical protein PWR01_4105 [Clostridiales bacterium]|jgi:hypothetical protein|nr:hypothetical protein [Clostridiales bacterium]MDN5283032.1 hypothetical protein [Candidatus Ozemobacter sp.]
MLNTKVMDQVSDLMIQALSEESISMAEPLTDVEIKLLDAIIEQTIDEGQLDEEISLVSGPRELIASIDQKTLDSSGEIQARKTLRRFYELFINLTAEPETRVLN